MDEQIEWVDEVQASFVDPLGIPVRDEALVREILAGVLKLDGPYDQPLEPYLSTVCWLVSVPRPFWEELKRYGGMRAILRSRYGVWMIPLT